MACLCAYDGAMCLAPKAFIEKNELGPDLAPAPAPEPEPAPAPEQEPVPAPAPKSEPMNERSNESAPSQFQVTIDRRLGSQLGINVTKSADKGLQINCITGGLFLEWNQAFPDWVVCAGDCIVEVNGQREVECLGAECRKKKVHRITIQRAKSVHYTVCVDRSSGKPLGVNVMHPLGVNMMHEGDAIVSNSVDEGLFGEWSSAHPKLVVDASSCCIVEINGGLYHRWATSGSAWAPCTIPLSGMRSMLAKSDLVTPRSHSGLPRGHLRGLPLSEHTRRRSADACF